MKTYPNRATMKLDACDRAQLVVVAYETGLVRGWGPSTGPWATAETYHKVSAARGYGAR